MIFKMVDNKEILWKYLRIDLKYNINSPLPSTQECCLSGYWLRNVCRELKYSKPPIHNQISKEEVFTALQLGKQVDKDWEKIKIQILPKNLVEKVYSLPKCGSTSSNHERRNLTYSQMLHYVSSLNIKNLWKDSFEKFSNHAIFKNWREEQTESIQPYSDVLKNVILRLYNCPIIPLSRDDGSITNSGGNSSSWPIHSAFFAVECKDYFFVFLRPSSFSVWDCASFSPSKLKNNKAGALFIVYQLLEATQTVHDKGLFLGDINLHNIRLEPDFSVSLIPQPNSSLIKVTNRKETGRISPKALHPQRDSPNEIESLQSEKLPLLSDSQSDVETFKPIQNSNKRMYFNLLSSNTAKSILFETCPGDKISSSQRLKRSSLLRLTEKWVTHEISNLDYLLCLNYFSGHSFESPVHYPILPWVIDFSSPIGGWRDLSKSKFRLNKGDQQLDQTYQHSHSDSVHHQVPHHIPEFFSEVTYYVYKARVTPKEVLKKHVRQMFVASHYPSTIQRMFDRTPEECIPEFYKDPTIFKSIHDDLPDLEVPQWCDGVDEFLKRHRAALESNYVSRRLHTWIDIYYGYKLTGNAAVKAKNVCLPLADNHESLESGGIIQLFLCPHPQKLTPSPFLSKSPPFVQPFPDLKSGLDAAEDAIESCKDSKKVKVGQKSKFGKVGLNSEFFESSKIELPSNYNPLSALNQLEIFYDFSLKTFGSLPEKVNPHLNDLGKFKQICHLLRVRDMQVLFCLIVQMFCPNVSRLVNPQSNLSEAYSLSVKVLYEVNEIPPILVRALKLICDFDSTKSKGDFELLDKFRLITDYGLPPPSSHQFLQPILSVINFPFYFYQLSSFVQTMKNFSTILEESYFSNTELLDSLVENHLKKTLLLLRQILPSVYVEDLGLIIPYVVELYKNYSVSAHAAWYLTDIVFQSFPPHEAKKHILPLIVKLYETESVSTKQHMRLFQKEFLIQLIVRLKLKTFLEYFTRPIIEGAGGYKNMISMRKMESSSRSLTEDKVDGGEEEANLIFSPEWNESKFLGDSPTISSVGEASDFFFQKDSVQSTDLDVTDVDYNQDDPDIFVFDGEDSLLQRTEESLLEDEDTLNGLDDNTSFDMTESLKTPSSETISLSSPRERKASGHSMKTFTLSPCSSDFEDQTSTDVTLEASKQSEISNPVPISQQKYLSISPSYSLHSSSLPETPICLPKRDKNSFVNCSKTYKHSSRVDSNMKESDLDSSLSEICCENLMWLSHRLGPVLTARHLSRNILRMLSLCYLPENGALLEVPFESRRVSITKKMVAGDRSAENIVQCLLDIADLYGEQFILLQYICYITKLVNWCGSKLTTYQEAGLIGAMTLLQHLLVKLSDTTFMECLEETLVRNAVYPVIRLLSSLKVLFPNGVLVRSILAWRVVDALYIMVKRVGPEMSKEKLMFTITRFFNAFDKVGSLKSNQDNNQELDASEINVSSPKGESIESRVMISDQLKKVFVPELAYMSYIPLCKLLTAKTLDESLPNCSLIRSMCLQFDESKQADLAAALTCSPLDPGIKRSDPKLSKTKIAITGNRIDIKESIEESFRGNNFDLDVEVTQVKREELESIDNQRHLKGKWLAYWEHEIGRSETETKFNFKQIQLQSFAGHTSSVKALYILDNEHSFLSGSKDKTVKLWSIKNQGDGNAVCGPQWTYSNHKKSVLDLAFCDSLRLVASCDSTIHVWDPFTGKVLKQLDAGKYSTVEVLSCLPSPSTSLIAATTDSTLKFVDLRTLAYTHEWKVTNNSVGRVRCVTPTGDGNVVAVAHSSGEVETIDLRTGQLLTTGKPHEGEILSMKWYEKGTFVSSALDQTICVWSIRDSKFKFHLKCPTEPVHLLKLFGDELLSGTTANRIGVHSSISQRSEFSCTKLHSNTFKGVLSSMEALPLNRQLLLGSDSGLIRLFC